ncbi:hypothetical protein STAQ_38680 [Allostella sp. ATCC 35155]|nr:hypothetical protein STAQ_38680 [Stella sp. ATCC 35155]
MRAQRSDQADLIIIVDDDEAVRRALTLLLSAYGWNVAAFPSATALMEEGLPDHGRACIVVDQDMPDMTGIALISALRRAGQDLPAILVSGGIDGRRHVERAAAAIPCTVFLRKPIDADQLLGCIGRCLGARPAFEPDQGESDRRLP